MHKGRRLVVAIVAATVLVCAGAPGSASGPRFGLLRQGAASVSLNWAGYIVHAPDGAPAATFTDVVGTWVQPRLSCTKGRAASSGFWVGFGGSTDTSTALEQTGTAANCTKGGRAVYYAWIELVPDPPVELKLRVAPGDRMLGAVAYVGGRVTVELKNLSRGTAVTRSFAVADPDLTSAEWIAEAPSLCMIAAGCRIDRLANFRQVFFSQAAVTADGHTGTIADPAWEATQVTMAPVTGNTGSVPVGGTEANGAGAIPSPLGDDGRSFSVSWSQHVTAAR